MAVFRLARRFLLGLADFLFGFDFFISYAHKDGYKYPEQLAEALAEFRYRVFLDTHDYRAGDDLQFLTRRYVRSSNTLLLVARPYTLSSKWVLREVEECLEAGGTPVAIDINNTLTNADDVNALKAHLLDRIYIQEALEDPDSAPSDEVIRQLRQRFVGVRQETFRLRMIAAAAITLAIVAGLALWQWREAVYQRDQAAARLVSQRVSNGIRAAIDGDLWSAWSWFANALQLAKEAGLAEDTHRNRLHSLRQQLPLLRQLWLEPAQIQAAAISPSGELVARYLKNDFKDSWIEIASVRDGVRLVEIKLGQDSLREMIFSPQGDELWILKVSNDPASQGRREFAEIYAVRDGTRKISRAVETDYAPKQWLDPETLALIASESVYLLHFRNGTISEEQRTGPTGERIEAVSINGSLLSTYSDDNHKLVIYRGQPPVALYALDFTDSPDRVVFSPDNQFMITLENRKLTVWKLGESIERVAESDLEGSVQHLEFDHQGHLLLSEKRKDDYRVSSLWNLSNGSRLKTFDHEKIVARWEFPADPTEGGAAATAVGMSLINPFEPWAMLSEDGERILTVSQRTQSYRIWDVETENALTPPLSHGGSKLLSVRFSEDGRSTVSSASDGTTQVWDVALPRRFKPLIGQPSTVTALAFIGRGEYLLSLSGGRAHVYAWANGEEVTTIGENLREARVVADGQLIVGQQKDRFRLWNAQTFQPVTEWLAHPSLDHVEISEQGRYAVSWKETYDEPAHVRFWDLQSQTIIKEMDLDRKWLHQVGLDENQRTAVFVVSSAQGSGWDIVVYDLDSGAARQSEGFLNFTFRGLFYNKHAACLMLFDGQNFWCLTPSVQKEAKPYRTTQSLLSELLVASQDGERAVLTNENHQIAQLVNVATGAVLTPEFRHEWKITQAVISPDSTLLLTVSGNRAHLWDLKTGEAIVPVIYYPDTVTTAALHPTARAFAVSTQKDVSDEGVAIYIEPLDEEKATVESLIAYGEVNSRQRVDESGARLPLSAGQVMTTWVTLSGLDPAVLQQPPSALAWYRQLEQESGNAIDLEVYYLNKILALAPSDVMARIERANLYFITTDYRKFLEDLDYLLNSAEAGWRDKLTPEQIDRWSLWLLAKDRPSDALRILPPGDADKEEREGWLFALASYGANEPGAYRNNCTSMLRKAQEIVQGELPKVEKWNTTVYAAHACFLADDMATLFKEIVELAATVAPTEGLDTLRILQGAVAIKEGDLASADKNLADLDEFLFAKALIVEMRFRQGDHTAGQEILAKLKADIAKYSEREFGITEEIVEIKYLIQVIETKLQKP